MRRWFIASALIANALMSALVLLLLLTDGGWDEATRLSAAESDVLVVLAVAAFVLNLLLVPVLGISFWARDRGFRRQAAALAARQPEPPHDEASS